MNYEDSISGMFDEAQSRVKQQAAEIERLQARVKELEASANEADNRAQIARRWSYTWKQLAKKYDYEASEHWLSDLATIVRTKGFSAKWAEFGKLKAENADLLERLQQAEAERDAARKALKPFADTYKVFVDMYAYAYGDLSNFLTDHADEEDITGWFKAAADVLAE